MLIEVRFSPPLITVKCDSSGFLGLGPMVFPTVDSTVDTGIFEVDIRVV